jgi:hypothetical protein
MKPAAYTDVVLYGHAAMHQDSPQEDSEPKGETPQP